jgi:hypothetical protein
VQDGTYTYLGTTSGSADAYTLTPSPSITAYATTQQFTAKISATNLTTTPYLQISAIANPTTTAVIKKLSATKTEIAVEASDLLINGIYNFQRNSANDAWIVLNPEKAFFNATNLTKATSTAQGINYLSLPTNPITIANNSSTPNTDIDFTAGTMTFHDGTGQALSTAMTKRLQSSGAWSAGNNGNLLLSGARANNSTYHLFALYKTDGTVDYGALLGVAGTDPNPTSVLPSGYTKYDYRGSILTDGSGNIREFMQYGKLFKLKTPSIDINNVAGTTTIQSHTLNSVPTGIKVKPSYQMVNNYNNGGGAQIYLSSPDQADINPSTYFQTASTISSTYTQTYSGEIITNKSRQINSRATSTNCLILIGVEGWVDFQLKI